MSSPENRVAGSTASIFCAPSASLKVSGSASHSSSSAPRVPSFVPCSKASSGMREVWSRVFKGLLGETRTVLCGGVCDPWRRVYYSVCAECRWPRVRMVPSSVGREVFVSADTGRGAVGLDGASEHRVRTRKSRCGLRRDGHDARLQRPHPGDGVPLPRRPRRARVEGALRAARQGCSRRLGPQGRGGDGPGCHPSPRSLWPATPTLESPGTWPRWPAAPCAESLRPVSSQDSVTTR